MKASVVRGKTPDELEADLADLKKEQFNLRFQRATGQLEKTGRVRQVRRDIARIKTIAAQNAANGNQKAAAPAAKAAKKPAKKKA